MRKLSGSTVNIRLDPFKVVITKLRLDKGRKSLIDRKAEGHAAADKDKAPIIKTTVTIKNVIPEFQKQAQFRPCLPILADNTLLVHYSCPFFLQPDIGNF